MGGIRGEWFATALAHLQSQCSTVGGSSQQLGQVGLFNDIFSTLLLFTILPSALMNRNPISLPHVACIKAQRFLFATAFPPKSQCRIYLYWLRRIRCLLSNLSVNGF